MATAADSTAYGGGAGGKFRKRPFRRPQPTPYDRPLTALRNTWWNHDNNSNGGNGGWLSRIVDPASKLISAGAHKLFSSVFRKRLLPPPPQPSPDEKVGPTENHLGDAITENPSRLQERERNEGSTQNNGSGTDGVAELEHILKQKTFTSSEIDRLTVLLHSRTVDKTGIAGQIRFGSIRSEPPAGHSRQEELDGTACGNGVNSTEVPGVDFTPSVRSKVNDDDVASPADLAKAYMGSRSTRVSPSMLGPRSETVREESHAFTTFQLHSPSITMQKPLSTAGTSQNDFVVPRSRGRSAIYSMARTPYSGVPRTATKGLGTSGDAFDERSMLSSQKALKRRCSVLENDIGAVGPIRRIRQKSNLLHSKNLGPPSSRALLTNVTPSELGEVSLYSSSKSQEDRGDMGFPVSSSQISSKSTEMGQRILQQLEKMTPSKEKSSEKKPGFSAGMSAMELTPAMLHGQARKSLETLNSLKYLQSDQVGGKKVDSLDVALHEVQDSTSKKQDKVYEISSNVRVNSSNKVFRENNEASITDNDIMDITKNTAPAVLKSAVDVPKKSRAFQMSAYEEYLELDDDVHSNGVASPVINEGKRNLEPSSMLSNGNMLQENEAKTTKANTPPAFPELKSSSNLVLKNTAVESSSLAEKGIGHTIPADSVSNKRIGSSAPSLQAGITSTSGEADIPASAISFDVKSSDKVSPASFFSSSAVESSILKDAKSDCPSSVFAFAACATDVAIKSPGSNNKSTEAVDLFEKSDNNSPSSFSGTFGQSTTGNTGVSATKVDGDAADTAAATTTSVSGSSDSLTSSVSFPSSQPGLKFGGSSMASNSAVMPASGTDTAGRYKETAFGNSTSSSLSGAASAAAPSFTIASFQFGVSTTSSTNSLLPSTFASTTESMPGQSGGSALPAPSGSSSLPIKSGVNQFGPLTSASSPFSSSSSGSSSVATSGSTSSALTNIFGSSSQPSNSPLFGSAFNNSSSGPSFGVASASIPSSNASSGFAFGTTSISAPANVSSAGVNFGTSSTCVAAGSSSSSSGFSFGASSASSTLTSSVSPGFAFGTTSTSAPANGSTDGASFGASPISAAVGSTSSVFAFGSSSSASSSTPLPSFSFGDSSASASSGAPSSTFSFGAPSASASSSAPSSTFSIGASSASAASSAAPPSTFSFGASSASAASSAAPPSTFLFGASSAVAASSSAPSSTFSFGASSASASSTALSSTFSFGASSASSGAPSSTFSFGASSGSASSSAQSPTFLFGASPASATTAPGSIFSFGSAASAPAPTTLQTSQPAFGNGGSVFGFGSTPLPSPLANNDQMTMEDTMAEDSMHPAATTPASVFGQSPTSNFAFGMAPAPAPAVGAAPPGANPFQFGSQQSQVAPTQNPFQNSGSFDGGSFSLGAGGNDKSSRRIVKVRSRNRKK